MARMLEAGVEIRKSLKTSAKNCRDARLTETVDDVISRVREGNDLTSSFLLFGDRYPRLFLDLLNVGEQTGSLPEVFHALADYYEAHVARMRQFRSQIAWPMFQLVAGILIIGLVIYILGIIGGGNTDTDILGLGLTGSVGAIKWFTMTFGTMGITWLGYKIINRNATGKMALHPFLIMVPGVSYVMRSFAISRFSWCFALTQQAGMEIRPSLYASFNATSNGAYIAAAPEIWRQISEGETLGTALARSKLFPLEYLQIVDTAEQTGTVPETLHRLSARFDEDAHRAMTWLTGLMAKMVWGIVALFIIFIVVNFVMTYVALINDAASQI
mgnify:CR=1 FL=1|tara:strand:- start:127 stop:1113 length:987 start_codon:yes stop_codon:yes gene_type:complete